VAAFVGAAKKQASADEREIGDRIEARQLADRVDEQQAAASRRRRRSGIDGRFARDGQAACRGTLLDGAGVGRITRHDHERRLRDLRARRDIGVEQRFVLAIVQAAADDDDVAGLVA
jgi:hypothetical protein